jgi:biopolymer transport protein ExbD
MPHPSLRRGRPIQRFDHGAPISTIDTRPMLFVALFIALIFLLAANQTRTHALLVELPQGFAPPDFAPAYMVVGVTEAGQVSLDGERVPLAGLSDAIRAKGFDWPIVLLRAQPDAAYEFVAHVLNKISEAGVAPSDICFDGADLAASGTWDKIAYVPAHSMGIREPIKPGDLRASSDLSPGGCERFFVPVPAV